MRGKWTAEALAERMCNGEPFTYSQLCLERFRDSQSAASELAYGDHDRLIDRTIQKLRRAGKIAFTRTAGKVVWSALSQALPPKGEEL